MKLEVVCKIVCVYISSFPRFLNFHHSQYDVPQGQPQYVVPISWLKMAARTLAKHLSSRQEKEKGGTKRGGQQSSTPVFCFPINELSQKSLVAQTVKNWPLMQENKVRSLGQEDLLEKEMAIHSSTLVWKIPWMKEPGRLQSMGLQRLSNFTGSLVRRFGVIFQLKKWQSHKQKLKIFPSKIIIMRSN